MPWFEYNQNNTYGLWLEPARVVWIEAADAEDANSRALDYGIYFDGMNRGKDCPCCGDRWYRAYPEDGYPYPDLPGDDVLLVPEEESDEVL